MEGDLSRENLEALLKAFKEAAEVKDRTSFFKTYRNCFVGSQAVKALIERKLASDENHALEIGNLLMRQGFFHHVTRDHEFKNQKLYYRFTEDEYSHGDVAEGSQETWKRLAVEGWDQQLVRLEELTDQSDWLVKGGQLNEVFLDLYNAILLDNVRPARWLDPVTFGKYNIIAIGAGAGGLVTAAGTAKLGGKAALIERNMMGGDCLNTGCVPSKALLKSSQMAHYAKNLSKYGITLQGSVTVDFPKVAERLRKVRSEISIHDSCRRFTSDLGVDLYLGSAKLVDRNTLAVNGQLLRFAKCCIATGGKPRVPMINGLESVKFYTSENIFNLTQLPLRMVFLGAGPISCELAQAFARFGSQVTVVTRGERVLSKEEPGVSQVIEQVFTEEGVTIIKRSSIGSVEETDTGDSFPTLKVTLTGESSLILECEALVIAVGRVANIEGLGLEIAEVEYTECGVKVNDFLQTTNPDIYAVGDCCTQKQFTHAADAMARIVIKNSMFFGRSCFSNLVIPRVTYTDPEVAVTGMSLQDLEASGTHFRVYEKLFERLDRAIVDGDTIGFIKIYCKAKNDDILGAIVVGSRAGEVINELTLAITQKISLTKIAGVIHPYPTIGEAVKHCADMCRRDKLSNKAKILMRELLGARR